MSDLICGTPCRYCGKYYGHTTGCFSNSLTGVAEKIMFQEISRRHDYKVYELDRQLSQAKELIKEMRDMGVKNQSTPMSDMGAKFYYYIKKNAEKIKSLLGEE